ncbi:hypothetical protein, unlikely [Trypanosoma congolense IL3000]|uniref:Uncharacterized protein n=1 Tax=Trypanosoma congolense (strain IL3000) TaxID=1068625 RepID=F9WA94_TRYCI|nr:hypothetical protein, unlikely [Trypanosoma congolense IL3000]
MKTRTAHINLLRLVPLPVVGCRFGILNLEDVKLHSFHFCSSRAFNKCIGTDSGVLRLSLNRSRCSKTTSRHLFALPLLPYDFNSNPNQHYHFKKLTPTRRLIKIYFLWSVWQVTSSCCFALSQKRQAPHGKPLYKLEETQAAAPRHF